MSAESSGFPIPTKCPLHGMDFAENPGAVYDQLRRDGPLSRVELAPGVPATLVTEYETALEVLRDEHTFTKDSRSWQQKMPEDCPVLPIMGWRPNANYAGGSEHARLRGAITDSLARVDPAVLRASVEDSAGELIDGFAVQGAADLLADYARLLPLLVLNQLFGCPPELSRRIVTGMMAIFDAVANQEQHNDVTSCVYELVALKRAQPGADVTSWLVQHSANLTDDEMAHQVIMMIGAGCEPQQNLIANALRLLLVDDRFAGDLSGGNMPVEEALNEVLWANPPLANFCAVYPVHDTEVAGVRLEAEEPVLISLAAANTAPSMASRERRGNRAHLAWGAGPHACPAERVSRLIASAAIETLLDRLPDLTLAVDAQDLTWRPGPFARALTRLPVHFPPETPGAHTWNASPSPTPSTSPAPTFTPREPDYGSRERPRWWNFLVRWWRGR